MVIRQVAETHSFVSHLSQFKYKKMTLISTPIEWFLNQEVEKLLKPVVIIKALTIKSSSLFFPSPAFKELGVAYSTLWPSQVVLVVKNLPANAGNT